MLDNEQQQQDPFAVGSTPNGVVPSRNYVMSNEDGSEIRVEVNTGSEGIEYTFNFDAVPEQGDFPVPPEGKYLAMVTDFDIKRSKTDKPMVVLTYTLLRNVDRPDVNVMNAKVWDYIVVSLSRVRDAFAALGLQLNATYKKSDIIGRQVVLLLKHGSFTGDDGSTRKTINVSRYFPHPDGAGYRELDEYAF